MAARNANRVLDNRLWDADGAEWTRVTRWLVRDEIEQHIAGGGPVVVHPVGAPLRWLTSADARDYWRRILPSTQFDNDPRSEMPEDGNGFTYTAVEWQRGSARLLGFEEHC